MDNFSIDIVCGSKEALDLAMQLAFMRDRPTMMRKAKQYMIDPEAGIIFLWGEEKDGINLPYPMDWKMCSDMTWEWLDHIEYPKCTYTGDGGVKKGWRIYLERYERVKGLYRTIIAIQPVWLEYGK